MDPVQVYAGLAAGRDDFSVDCGGSEASGASFGVGSGYWGSGMRPQQFIGGSESADSHIDTLGTFRKGKHVRKHIFPALTVAGLLALSPAVAFAGGSDSPTPYEVTEAGVTLPDGHVFLAHGHINVRIDGQGYGIHFDPNNNHPGGAWIGENFIPWTAFGVDAGCAEWVQIHGFNEHFGEGGQVPVCFGNETPEPEPDPEEPVTPLVPLEPATPVIPATPLEPATPVVPVTPLEPVVPDIPETPEVPAPAGVPVVTAETTKTVVPTGGAVPVVADPVTVG